MFKPFTPLLAYEMLDIALGQNELPPEQRAKQLHRIGGKIGNLLQTNWTTDPHAREPLICDLVAYAALPALLKVARGEPHDAQSARAVHDNIVRHSSKVLASELSNPSPRPKRIDQRFVIGRLSELSVFGLLWWGIANRQFTPDSYVLPARRDDDVGKLVAGKKTGYDFGLQEPLKALTRIQVKASALSTKKAQSEYAAGIVPLSPTSLLDIEDTYYSSIYMLDCLVRGDRQVLTQASRQAKRVIRRSQERELQPQETI